MSRLGLLRLPVLISLIQVFGCFDQEEHVLSTTASEASRSDQVVPPTSQSNASHTLGEPAAVRPKVVMDEISLAKAGDLYEEARGLEDARPSDARTIYHALIEEYPDSIEDPSEEDYGINWREKAEDRIKYLDCVRDETPVHRTAKIQDMLDVIRSSINSQDADLLKEIAHCGFTVGLSESDDVRIESAKLFARVISEYLRFPIEDLPMIEAPYDDHAGAGIYFDSFVVVGTSAPGVSVYLERTEDYTSSFRHVFTLKSNGNWYLARYSTADRQLLDRLRTEMKELARTDEPIGP